MAAGAGALAFPAIVRGQNLNNRLDVVAIGVGGRGSGNLADVARTENIVAVCDVAAGPLDAAAAKHPGARRYTDFRKLYDAEKKFDAVIVSTCEHTHAFATLPALRMGKHVYCEKPLTYNIWEARLIREAAAKAKVATQMGTQIHATANYRRVVEAVRGGAIGRVTAVDVWQHKSWGGGKLTPGAVCPPNLDWDLWLGETPRVPYIEKIHPANWRRYWAYGTGTLGDMGCHVLDLPVWALGLAPCADLPGSGAKPLAMEVRAEGPAVDAVGTPPWLEVSWAIPGAAGEGNDPLVLRWFDGGRMSPFVQEIGAKDRQDYHGRFSVCFQGTQGAIFANYDELVVWPPARAAEWYGRTADEAMGTPGADGKPAARPVLTPAPGSPAAAVPTLPPSRGHHAEWLQAIREGKPDAPLCNFAYSGRLTELVLAGTDAYRAGKPIRVTI